jgi:DNA-binding MarR family transcriptional regulator
MEKAGVLKKTKSPEDSRCYQVSLTAKGRNIVEAAIPLQSKEINHCFSDVLSKAQMKSLIEIADAISTHMNKHHPLNKKVER